MKKIFALLLLMAVSVSAFAQKSYVRIYYKNDYCWLDGDIPIGIDKKYFITGGNYSIGYVLNLLSERGYEVEFMCDSYTYLLSKKKPGSTSSYQTVRAVADDNDVYEVARYNLQGLPVKESEKGIQIIVYSNYTTKTIIRE